MSSSSLIPSNEELADGENGTLRLRRLLALCCCCGVVAVDVFESIDILLCFIKQSII
jgi:hypothetical protein